MANLTPTDFEASLLPASFRGVFFHVVDNTIKTGQRVAEHQYPYRQTPYSEVMGKQARQYAISAFLVGGPGDLQSQENQLLTACETPSAGTLIHPMLGSLNVVCTACEVLQTIAGRYVEIKLTFVEAGSILSPSTAADTQANTINQAASAQNTAITSYDADIGNGTTPVATSMTPTAFPSPAAQSIDTEANAAVANDNTGF